MILSTRATLNVPSITQMGIIILERFLRETRDETTTLTEERMEFRNEYRLFLTLYLGGSNRSDEESGL
jgi:hypothetical protein